jgi:ketosteroid isomerase-like protein
MSSTASRIAHWPWFVNFSKCYDSLSPWFGLPGLPVLRTRMRREKMRTAMKIRISLLALVGLAVWALVSAAAPSKPDSTSSKILALENKWNAAYKHGDVATMESLLAEDFIITVEDGSTFSKSGYIAHNGDSTLHVEITEMSGLNVRMHGNAVVVTGAYHEKGVSKGKPYDYHDRFTDVWMNINGKWLVIASHYSIPASD